MQFSSTHEKKWLPFSIYIENDCFALSKCSRLCVCVWGGGGGGAGESVCVEREYVCMLIKREYELCMCLFQISCRYALLYSFSFCTFSKINVSNGNQLVECQECRALYHQVMFTN